MAKLKAPLMSLGAAGQLGKSLVFFPWKGLDVVREYVVPSNPRSAPQTTQRGYMTAALVEFHAALYTAADMIAWNRYAGVLSGAMSGFNAMVKRHMEEARLGSTWERLRNCQTYGITDIKADIDVGKAGGGNAPTLYWGTSKTFMPNELVMVDIGGNYWRTQIAGLTTGNEYFYYVDVGTTAVDYGRTGIFQFRTT